MKKPDEQIFIGIWKLAKEEGQKASQLSRGDELYARGGIIIFDKRRKFTKWVAKTHESNDYDDCVYISGGGGQWYFQAHAYADAFCKSLKCFGIACKNDVVLD